MVTLKTHIKMKYWLFIPLVVFGLMEHVKTGMYYKRYDHRYDKSFVVYDKLTDRQLPHARIWARPG